MQKINHVIETQGLFALDMQLAQDIMKHPKWVNPIRQVQIQPFAGQGDPQEALLGEAPNLQD